MTLLNTVGGSVLSDIITWVRRIIKSPSVQSISDVTIGDYINRFYVYDMPERIQLFEMKRQYTFLTIENIFMYQFPYQNYQLIEPPAYCDGVEIGFCQSNQQFYNIFPEFVNNEFPLLGDGTIGPYTTTVSQNPIIRGFTDDLGNVEPYVYVTATDVNGNRMYIVDNGSLYTTGTYVGQGILNQTDETFQTIIASEVGAIDYVTGDLVVTFNNGVVDDSNIEVQTSPFAPGCPRICLFFNNIIRLFPVPDRSYKMQFDCFITPAQFLATNSAVQFAYMAEYIARGAARKILTDNADYEQFQFYEPLFREQENLVLRRTERQNSTQRTPTIFAGSMGSNPYTFGRY